MKTTFEVLNKQGNLVTSFGTRAEADVYTSKNPDHVVIEKSSYFSLTNIFYFITGFALVKLFGLLGLACAYLGYWIYTKLSTKNAKWLSGVVGGVVALVSYVVIYAILFE